MRASPLAPGRHLLPHQDPRGRRDHPARLHQPDAARRGDAHGAAGARAPRNGHHALTSPGPRLAVHLIWIRSPPRLRSIAARSPPSRAAARAQGRADLNGCKGYIEGSVEEKGRYSIKVQQMGKKDEWVNGDYYPDRALELPQTCRWSICDSRMPAPCRGQSSRPTRSCRRRRACGWRGWCRRRSTTGASSRSSTSTRRPAGTPAPSPCPPRPPIPASYLPLMTSPQVRGDHVRGRGHQAYPQGAPPQVRERAALVRPAACAPVRPARASPGRPERVQRIAWRHLTRTRVQSVVFCAY